MTPHAPEKFVWEPDDLVPVAPAPPPPLHQWSHLNRQQLGAYAEYFIKMHFTMAGFQVYGTEVDDRGIDFVARYEKGAFMEVQVKSLRRKGYVFMEKTKFEPDPHLHLALAIFDEGNPPELYLIPSQRWLNSDHVFVSRDYEGKKSEPEWGLSVSLKNRSLLADHSLHTALSRMIASTPRTPSV